MVPYLRTHRLATMLGMTRQAVVDLFDAGALTGYRLGTGNQNRYVERRSVVRWLFANGVQPGDLPEALIANVMMRGRVWEWEGLLAGTDFVTIDGRAPTAVVVDAAGADPDAVREEFADWTPKLWVIVGKGWEAFTPAKRLPAKATVAQVAAALRAGLGG